MRILSRTTPKQLKRRAAVAILPKQTEEIANPFDGITSDELDELLAVARGLNRE
jgi:hypothetical protein